MSRFAVIAKLSFLAGMVIAAPSAWCETRPVVVELFTSQGCSSCPPADALLGKLAQRPDVIALGFHIDYWDRLGWKDPLSSEDATARQRTYARRFNGGQVYTPQMVVDGTREMVGSDQGAVASGIRAAQPEAAAPVHFSNDGRRVSIGPGRGSGTILLVRFVRHRTTRIGAGENASRTAEDSNAVKTIARLGDWSGSGRDLAIDPPAKGEGIAVLVQAADGQILAAGATYAN